jgi:hypothetical protein
LTKKKAYFHPDKLAFYDKLIASLPDVQRKGATMPYTSVNGNMFSFLDKDGFLGLRLPEKERIDVLKKYNTNLCEAHGAVLKEYVLIPEKLAEETKKMKEYFEISFKYANSLKPKSSKKTS